MLLCRNISLFVCVGVMFPCQSLICKLNLQFKCDNANLANNNIEAKMKRHRDRRKGPVKSSSFPSLVDDDPTLLRSVKWVSSSSSSVLVHVCQAAPPSTVLYSVSDISAARPINRLCRCPIVGSVLRTSKYA